MTSRPSRSKKGQWPYLVVDVGSDVTCVSLALSFNAMVCVISACYKSLGTVISSEGQAYRKSNTETGGVQGDECIDGEQTR